MSLQEILFHGVKNLQQLGRTIRLVFHKFETWMNSHHLLLTVSRARELVTVGQYCLRYLLQSSYRWLE
jgi:hypothetical protein